MTDKKQKRTLKILLCFVYFFSYLTRHNYSAALPEIISDLNVLKTTAGIAVTASLISYGVFQTISGFIGDKLKPEKVVFFGLFSSSIINILVSLVRNIYVINVLWCINGIFQSLIWPPLVRIIIEKFGEKEFSKIVIRVTQASYMATVFVYAFVPFIIYLLNWQMVFFLFGGASMAFSVLFVFKTKYFSFEKATVEKNEQKEETKNSLDIKMLLKMCIVPIILSVLVAGIVRDGISTWLPSYISEVYDVTTFVSILTGAVIPISCALFLELLNIIGNKIGNEIKTAAIYYLVALLSCFALWGCFSLFPPLDVFLMALITVCVHGVNLMLVCNVPKRFSKVGKTSTLSGILNSVVYAGASLSVYVTAYVATNFGWENVAVLWMVLILIAFCLCFFGYKKYGKNIKKYKL